MSSTRAEAAHHALRWAIVKLAIESGELLDGAALGERFASAAHGCTKPSSGALEQSVVASLRRTPYLRRFSLTALQPLFETRLLLQVPVAGVAANRATSPGLTALDSDMANMERAVACLHVYDTIAIDDGVHSLVGCATRNRYLAEATNKLDRGSLRLGCLAHPALGLKKITSNSAKGIAGFRTGQRPLVEEVMRQHVLLSQSRGIRAFATAVGVTPGNGATVGKGADR